MRSRAVATSDHPVRRRRREQRLTQAELATAVGVSRQTVIAVEQGDYAPSVHLALRIARTLSATVEELFGEDEDTTRGEARR
jgi:putative transcriptional regulator